MRTLELILLATSLHLVLLVGLTASAQANQGQVCVVAVDKLDAAFPSERIVANCKKDDIIVLVVPYGHETMLGGSRYCDFSAAIVIVDDPEQKIRKQTCRYIGEIRPVRPIAR